MPGMKKKRIAAVASALLILLLLPCVHASAHHHDDALDSVCAAAHTECRDCSAAPCPQKPEIRPADSSPAVELPVRQTVYVHRIESCIPAPSPVALSFCDVFPLLTVQLLI